MKAAAAADLREIAVRAMVREARRRFTGLLSDWVARGQTETRAQCLSFFESEVGAGLIAYLLGLGWYAAQGETEGALGGDLAREVSREIRLQGGEQLLGGVFDEVVRPVVENLKKGPLGSLEGAAEKVRIQTPPTDSREVEIARLREELRAIEDRRGVPEARGPLTRASGR